MRKFCCLWWVVWYCEGYRQKNEDMNVIRKKRSYMVAVVAAMLLSCVLCITPSRLSNCEWTLVLGPDCFGRVLRHRELIYNRFLMLTILSDKTHSEYLQHTARTGSSGKSACAITEYSASPRSFSNDLEPGKYVELSISSYEIYFDHSIPVCFIVALRASYYSTDFVSHCDHVGSLHREGGQAFQRCSKENRAYSCQRYEQQHQLCDISGFFGRTDCSHSV